MNLEQARQKIFVCIGSLDKSDSAMISSAIELAEDEHQGQYRKQHKDTPGYRDPYLVHPLRVALILFEELGIRDCISLTAAVLHDVVEDGRSRPTLGDIESRFNREVREAVALLTKEEPGQNGASAAEREKKLAIYHQLIERAPLHVRMIKLSDRLDNVRETLLVDNPAFQLKYLKETREVYLPLARRTNAFFFEQLTGLCDEIEAML